MYKPYDYDVRSGHSENVMEKVPSDSRLSERSVRVTAHSHTLKSRKNRRLGSRSALRSAKNARSRAESARKGILAWQAKDRLRE